jgi:hypothetical protein
VASEPGITADRVGAMAYAEWGRLLAALAESPGWVGDRLAGAGAASRTRPAPGRWSALEVLAHLRDSDRDVYLPRLEIMLTHEQPAVPAVDLVGEDRVAGYAALEPDAVLAEWHQLRRRLVTRLAPLGRGDWARMGVHSLRGHYPLGEMVREWAEHDLSHRRQLALALGLLT